MWFMTTARSKENIQDFFVKLQSMSGSSRSPWAKQISWSKSAWVCKDGSGADCSVTLLWTKRFEATLLHFCQNSKHSLANLPSATAGIKCWLESGLHLPNACHHCHFLYFGDWVPQHLSTVYSSCHEAQSIDSSHQGGWFSLQRAETNLPTN